MINRLTALFDRRPQTAEDWLARMGRPDVGTRDQEAFMAWMEADPDHLRQYETIKAAQAALSPLRGVFADDLNRLRRPSPGPAFRLGRPLAIGGALAAAFVVGIALLPLARQSNGVSSLLYEAGATEIRDVVLSDGTRVTLDAGSAIRVTMADDVRRVEMTRGAAYFDVAHDADHPFQVAVADRKVIVTGTRFVTTLNTAGGEVALLEGRVLVGRHDATQKGALDEAVPLMPGHRLAFRAGEAGGRPEAADVELTTAWRQRRLIFRDVPLSQVIAAAGRYSEQPLVIDDPRLARMRVTAVLPLEGAQPLVERMDELLPIRVIPTADGRAAIRAE